MSELVELNRSSAGPMVADSQHKDGGYEEMSWRLRDTAPHSNTCLLGAENHDSIQIIDLKYSQGV